jgi:hypothetical protein
MLSSASPNPLTGPRRQLRWSASLGGRPSLVAITNTKIRRSHPPLPLPAVAACSERLRVRTPADLAAEAEPLKCAVLMRVVAGLYVVRGTSRSVHYTRKLCQ